MTKMRITLGVFCLVLGLAGNGFAQEASPELQSAMEDLGLPTETALPPTGDVYVVARGDTLWDTCQVFFGDPEAWPGLWSITNE